MMDDQMFDKMAADMIAWGSVGGDPDPSADLLVSDWVEYQCDHLDRDYDDELQVEADLLLAALVRKGLRRDAGGPQ